MDMDFGDPSEISHSVFEAYLTFALFDKRCAAPTSGAALDRAPGPRSAAIMAPMTSR